VDKSSIFAHLESAAELYHLLRLDVLESVDACDTVTDAQDAAGLLEVGLGGLTQDALFQNGGDLGRGRRRRVCASGRQLLGHDAGGGAILAKLKRVGHGHGERSAAAQLRAVKTQETQK
jgi:hypothetical protein